MIRPRFVRARRSVAIYCDNVHWFAFRWGVTVRWRVDGGWKHLRINAERNEWGHVPDRCSRMVQIESWLTAGGPTGRRVIGSKRYVRFKVAL